MTKLAVVFPGQGSQQVGMLSEIAEEEAIVRDTFGEASDSLGYDLWRLVQEGPAERLGQTEYTQPALLTASTALWRVWHQKNSHQVDFVAGHSLGEYSALVASEVNSFPDALRLVQKRGQAMQSAVPPGKGGMAAILGLADDRIIQICAENSDGNDMVEVVNFNSPGQVVIAGLTRALSGAVEACKTAGARRTLTLAVSAPFHSSLMRPAADQMREVLAEVTFSDPQIEIVQNVDARAQTSPQTIRENLLKQMYSAVLWTDTVQYLVSQGATRLVECGPGRVLAGLARRIDKSLDVASISSPDTLASAL